LNAAVHEALAPPVPPKNEWDIELDRGRKKKEKAKPVVDDENEKNKVNPFQVLQNTVSQTVRIVRGSPSVCVLNAETPLGDFQQITGCYIKDGPKGK
jgi:hypothetical protein